MSYLCKVTRTVKCSYTASCEVPSLQNDFGRGDMLLSFRTMANRPTYSCLHSIRPQKDGLFQRAASFQDSLEDEFKKHYATNDFSRHPDYHAELQTLL